MRTLLLSAALALLVGTQAAAQDALEGTYGLARWSFGAGGEQSTKLWVQKTDDGYQVTRLETGPDGQRSILSGPAQLEDGGWLRVRFLEKSGMSSRLGALEGDGVGKLLATGIYRLSGDQVYGLFTSEAGAESPARVFEYGTRGADEALPGGEGRAAAESDETADDDAAADETAAELDPDETAPRVDVEAVIQVPQQVMAVPGAPAVGRQPVEVLLEGAAAELTLSGPGRLLRGEEVVLSDGGSLRLEPGDASFQLEGTGDGTVRLAVMFVGEQLDAGETQVVLERLYVLMFGYQGAEEDYLEGDLGKTRRNIVPHLGADYVTIEDGSSFDQSAIDAALDDPKTPRKVVIDWCTTREDELRYLRRGTVRGIFWGSHGFMEPWPSCPDEELDHFESRIWSAVSGSPASGDAKTWVREWREALTRSVETHGALDFVLMHSCCTGGIGKYADEVWKYCTASTKSRAERVLGTPLPPHDQLRYTSFDALAEQAGFLKTYVGPSYFGMWDVPWGKVRSSLNPQR